MKEYRKRIDEIDRDILRLFEERMRTAEKIGEYKKQNGLPITDENREKEVVETAKNAVSADLSDYAQELMKELISLSKKYQEK